MKLGIMSKEQTDCHGVSGDILRLESKMGRGVKMKVNGVILSFERITAL